MCTTQQLPFSDKMISRSQSAWPTMAWTHAYQKKWFGLEKATLHRQQASEEMIVLVQASKPSFKPAPLRLDDQGREIDEFGNVVQKAAESVTTLKVSHSYMTLSDLHDALDTVFRHNAPPEVHVVHCFQAAQMNGS